MAEGGVTELERPRSEERGQPGRRGAGERSPKAEEIQRIVEVADALGVSPAVAAAALRDDDGEVSTDVRLRRSIEVVEGRLSRGGRRKGRLADRRNRQGG